jgi:photosynthetic reaction center cytochrome c subunit
MTDSSCIRGVLALAGMALLIPLTGCERPSADTLQTGYRGTAMVQLETESNTARKLAANQLPPPSPALPPSGTKASAMYQNVQILGDLDSNEFTGLMLAMTSWVSPKEGCVYCHDAANLADDSKYTKVVARRMIQMTRSINADWSAHVKETGVTCFTCHRGQPVPANIWYSNDGYTPRVAYAGYRAGQNAPADSVALSSLPEDPFSPLLRDSGQIRVASTHPLPAVDMPVPDIKQTEATYGLMMHLSDALGVNCNYCHNSRLFSNWKESTPQRVQAWHGIQMARTLNNEYLEPLKSTLPAERLGPVMADAPKANCSTCHQGAAKPLLGVSMVKDFPSLGAAHATMTAAAPAAPAVDAPSPAVDAAPGPVAPAP